MQGNYKFSCEVDKGVDDKAMRITHEFRGKSEEDCRQKKERFVKNIQEAYPKARITDVKVEVVE